METAQSTVVIECLQYAEAHRHQPHAAAGQRQAHRVDHLARVFEALFKLSAERLALFFSVPVVCASPLIDGLYFFLDVQKTVASSRTALLPIDMV
jgi:hypothetical protein